MPNVTVNGRAFTSQQVANAFALYDSRATRPEVRDYLRSAQGSGVSNQTLAALRDLWHRTRRSEGYAIAKNARPLLRDTRTSELKPPTERTITGRVRGVGLLSPGRRPLPPSELNSLATVRYSLLDGGRRTGEAEIRVFDVGPDQAPLSEQVRQRAERGGGSVVPEPFRRSGRSYDILNLRPELPRPDFDA